MQKIPASGFATTVTSGGMKKNRPLDPIGDKSPGWWIMIRNTGRSCSGIRSGTIGLYVGQIPVLLPGTKSRISRENRALLFSLDFSSGPRVNSVPQ